MLSHFSPGMTGNGLGEAWATLLTTSTPLPRSRSISNTTLGKVAHRSFLDAAKHVHIYPVCPFERFLE